MGADPFGLGIKTEEELHKRFNEYLERAYHIQTQSVSLQKKNRCYQSTIPKRYLDDENNDIDPEQLDTLNAVYDPILGCVIFPLNNDHE